MSVSLVFDVIIALICAIIILKNAFRGFIKSFVTFARTVLAFLLAYIFNAPLARLLSDKIFLGCARGWIYDAFCSTQIGEDQYALYQLFDGIPRWFTNLTVSSGVEDWMIEEYFAKETPAPMWALNQMSNSLGDALSMLISTIVAFTLIFILVEILISVIGALLNKVGKIPMLKVLNILLGACIGIVISSVVAWLISKGICWVIDFGANYYPDVFTRDFVDDTLIMKFFLNNDLWTWVKNMLSGN